MQCVDLHPLVDGQGEEVFFFLAARHGRELPPEPISKVGAASAGSGQLSDVFASVRSCLVECFLFLFFFGF